MRDQDPSPNVAFHRAAARRALVFGPFRFDTLDRTLTRDGEEIRLPPRALAILEYLLERSNRVVSKQELIDAVWKEAFVGETSLTEAIGVLRQALGDSAAEPAVIQTIHRRGYRFVGALRADAQPFAALTPVATPAEVPATTPPIAAPRRRAALVAAAAVVATASVSRCGRCGRRRRRRRSHAPRSRCRPARPLRRDSSRSRSRRCRPTAARSSTSPAPPAATASTSAPSMFEAIALPGTDGAHGAFFPRAGSRSAFSRAPVSSS